MAGSKTYSETYSVSEDRRQKALEALRKPIDPKKVSARTQAGTTLLYLKGHQAIRIANEVFGEDGWSMRVDSVQAVQTGDGKTVYYAIVTVDALGVQKSDVGCNPVAGDKPEAHDTAIKGAVTDAMKRAFRQFGDVFGNSLYDPETPENRSMRSGNIGTKAKVIETGPIKCEEPGCTNLLEGYTNSQGQRVNSQDQAGASRKRYGIALCMSHLTERYKASKATE